MTAERFARLRRLRHLVQRFVDIARGAGLRVALSMAWRKAKGLRRAFSRRNYLSWLVDPGERGRVSAQGCRISVIVPVHDTPPDYLEECIQSVIAQTYENWELCICDDASAREDTRAALERYRGTDPRIRIVRSERNLHISRATNLAAEQASGKFLAFLDHDDRLHPLALYEVARADLAQGDIDLLYSDEDKLDASGAHRDTYLKPDWSPEHLDSVMYVLHMLVVRKSLFWALGGLRHEVAGAQDYDLALRASAKARRVHHIDKVLYHWRMMAGSAAAAVDAKPYALQAARRALVDSVAERGLQAEVEDGLLPGTFRVRRAIRGDPPVTLLILTNHGTRKIPGRGEVDLLGNFVTSILERSTYRNRRIVVADNGNAPGDARRRLEGCGAKLVSYALAGSFNFAKKLNFALRSVETEQVILLNDDLEVVTPDWIESLLEFTQEPDIGIAGAQLLYADGRIQHAGIVLGTNDSAAHIFHGMPGSSIGYNGYSHLIRNYSAVTGAVMATRMSLLAKVGGFDEQFAVDFNDVDFCLRVRALGLRVVYTPYCRLLHFEGSTQQRVAQDPAEVALFSQRWRAVIERDPCYNVNLPRDSVDLVGA
jgi:GT2 family glycosyltransferase